MIAHWCGSEFLFKDRIFLFMAEAKRWPFALKKEGTEEIAHKQTHTNTVNIFDKGAKIIQWRNNGLFNKRCWDKWEFTCPKKKGICHLDIGLTPFTKTDWKWSTVPLYKMQNYKIPRRVTQENGTLMTFDLVKLFRYNTKGI